MKWYFLLGYSIFCSACWDIWGRSIYCELRASWQALCRSKCAAWFGVPMSGSSWRARAFLCTNVILFLTCALAHNRVTRYPLANCPAARPGSYILFVSFQPTKTMTRHFAVAREPGIINPFGVLSSETRKRNVRGFRRKMSLPFDTCIYINTQ